MKFELDLTHADMYIDDAQVEVHARAPTRRSIFGQDYDFAEDYFGGDDSETASQHTSKRRRSAESASHTPALTAVSS